MFGNNTLSMSEEQFANPEEFLPERWLDSNDPPKQRQMGMCVLPFGIGKRNCMGRRFAEQEIHLATIKVIRCDLLYIYTVNFEYYLYTMNNLNYLSSAVSNDLYFPDFAKFPC